jgi:hypothetical protein
MRGLLPLLDSGRGCLQASRQVIIRLLRVLITTIIMTPATTPLRQVPMYVHAYPLFCHNRACISAAASHARSNSPTPVLSSDWSHIYPRVACCAFASSFET